VRAIEYPRITTGLLGLLRAVELNTSTVSTTGFSTRRVIKCLRRPGAGRYAPGLMVTSPLRSKRILLLRPAGQAGRSAAAVQQRGAEPLALPAIEIHDPPDPQQLRRALARLRAYHWVVFTSANGVERSLAALAQLGLDATALGGVRVAVIGPGTASALQAAGLEPELVARSYVAEELARALLERGDVRDVLLLRALRARDALPRLLRRAGVRVDVVAAYQTRPVSGDRAERLVRLLTADPPDVVMLTASSTVRALAQLLGRRTAEVLAHSTVASIGPVTTATAEQLRVRVDVTADRHSVDGLLDALERYFTAAVARPETCC
jgi:uroporphyrinogen-III synthase